MHANRPKRTDRGKERKGSRDMTGVMRPDREPAEAFRDGI